MRRRRGEEGWGRKEGGWSERGSSEPARRELRTRIGERLLPHPTHVISRSAAGAKTEVGVALSRMTVKRARIARLSRSVSRGWSAVSRSLVVDVAVDGIEPEPATGVFAFPPSHATVAKPRTSRDATHAVVATAAARPAREPVEASDAARSFVALGRPARARPRHSPTTIERSSISTNQRRARGRDRRSALHGGAECRSATRPGFPTQSTSSSPPRAAMPVLTWDDRTSEDLRFLAAAEAESACEEGPGPRRW